jgi:hypothetical protein
VAFEKEYIMRCSSAEWISKNGCALRWCHRDVGRLTGETVGFPEWTAQFCVCKTTGKDSSEACAIVFQNCAVYYVFPSGMTSHSKIAQFNWRNTDAHWPKIYILLKIFSLKRGNVSFWKLGTIPTSSYGSLPLHLPLSVSRRSHPLHYTIHYFSPMHLSSLSNFHTPIVYRPHILHESFAAEISRHVDCQADDSLLFSVTRWNISHFYLAVDPGNLDINIHIYTRNRRKPILN